MDDLPRGHFGAILADPPWAFLRWSGPAIPAREQPYNSMSMAQIAELPIRYICADNCVLFLWVTWPMLMDCLKVVESWGFTYKTCAFSWMKADPYRLFADDKTPFAGLGYWTRANTEPCLLATRGKPKRLKADVRQGIIAPRREHSRKPDEIHGRIERLVAGPYLELFARQEHAGWTTWGNEVGKFGRVDEPVPEMSEWDEMWAKPFVQSLQSPAPAEDQT